MEEAAKRVAGKQPDDDGRVIEGKSNEGPDARSGRFWPFITGFPFPLGPLLQRETVRQEVRVTPFVTHMVLTFACSVLPKQHCHCFGTYSEITDVSCTHPWSASPEADGRLHLRMSLHRGLQRLAEVL